MPYDPALHHPLDAIDSVPSRGRELAHAYHRVITAREALNAEWRKSLQIGVGEMVTLGHLWNHGPASMQALAERVGVSGPTMTAIADRLQTRGWAERTHDTVDRRRVLLAASEASTLAFKPCVEPLVDRLVDISSRYDDAQLNAILDFLEDARAVQEECTSLLRVTD